MMRTFIAIDIPKELKDKIYDMQSKIKTLDIKASYPHKKNFEITLIFLGEKTEEEVNLIRQKLSTINFNKFKITISDIGSFPSISRINNVWIGVDSDSISRLVSSICRSLNFKLDRPFNPHITLCRIKSNKNLENVRNFVSQNKNIDLGNFEAEEFVLKKSTLTSNGPIYEILDVYALS